MWTSPLEFSLAERPISVFFLFRFFIGSILARMYHGDAIKNQSWRIREANL